MRQSSEGVTSLRVQFDTLPIRASYTRDEQDSEERPRGPYRSESTQFASTQHYQALMAAVDNAQQFLSDVGLLTSTSRSAADATTVDERRVCVSLLG